MSSKLNIKLNKRHLNMTPYSKYLLNSLVLLFTLSAGYSGYVIYQNKHNHHSSNIFASWFGRDKPKLTAGNSDLVRQNAKLHQQYDNGKTAVKPSAIQEDARRQAIFNFYTAYLSDRTNNQSQDDAIAKYGTTNLAAQYKSAQSGFDPLTCGAEGAGSTPISFTIGEKASDNSYTVDFRDSKNPVSTSQVMLADQGSISLVDSVACLLAD